MSEENPPYNQLYITAWASLSIFLGVIFFGMFILGDHFLYAGKCVWDLIRWLASPII